MVLRAVTPSAGRARPPGLEEFLLDYPGIAPRPVAGQALILRGRFAFLASPEGKAPIEDAYDLRIEVPADFPHSLPTVTETGGRIPRRGEYHVNGNDDTLCLGSPLSLMLRLAKSPTLPGFAASCLVPYLYAISHKLRHGGPMFFGELAHGTPGVLADYRALFGVRDDERVFATLDLLGKKKRKANKYPCPCDCGRRIGRCNFNSRVREFRIIAGRCWYREYAHALRKAQRVEALYARATRG